MIRAGGGVVGERDDRLRMVRLFAVCGAVLNPIMYPFARAGFPDHHDPLAVRLVIAFACLALLTSTYSHLARRSRHAALALCVGMQGWYLYLAGVNGLDVFAFVNATVFVFAAVVLCVQYVEVGVFLGITSGMVALAYTSNAEHLLPQTVVQVALILLGVVCSLVLLDRTMVARALETSEVEAALQAAHAAELAEEVERRKAAEAAAHEANQSKSAFLANMSHELRTPLTAIVGYGELVDEELEGTSQEGLRQDVAHILTSANHLLGLIDEILDLARIESGKVVIHPERVPLSELLDACVQVVRPAAERQSIALELDTVTAVVWGDPGRTRQIVLNLLSNAIKFTAGGTVTVRGRIVDGHAEIDVEDTGVGIPADSVATLFDPFVQVDNEATKKAGGTGLGLAIGRQLANGMGGELSVRSELGVGSCFTLRLPLAEDS